MEGLRNLVIARLEDAKPYVIGCVAGFLLVGVPVGAGLVWFFFL
ncbi:hypothetical protein [Mesorhizobium sp. M1060]